MTRFLLILMASLSFSTQLLAEEPRSADNPLPQVRMETSEGVIEIMLRPDVAPETVANFLEYVESGYYRDTIFHRVIPGFMIQGGGFDRDLVRKDTRSPIPNEGSPTLKNLRGTIAMARTGQPHSATSQFFINVVDNPYLNASDNPKKWGYAVFGKVTEGMGVVDAIASTPTGHSGGMADVPREPVTINNITIINSGNASGN
ncbi:peptidylprolyl isomerase [Marinobacter sp. DUT-3]|uniref:peptidylprolyl isomerase n=1 Tax=unclassified Marinobacter TaxID=83889 RepID=UPI00387B8BDA